MTIGERVRQRRRDLGMSAAELAGLAGITPPYVSLLESGKRAPRRATVRALASALRCEERWLLEGAGPCDRQDEPELEPELLELLHELGPHRRAALVSWLRGAPRPRRSRPRASSPRATGRARVNIICRALAV